MGRRPGLHTQTLRVALWVEVEVRWIVPPTGSHRFGTRSALEEHLVGSAEARPGPSSYPGQGPEQEMHARG